MVKKLNAVKFDEAGAVIALDVLQPNPNNPRFVRDHRFTKLMQSIKDFPQMMRAKPITLDSEERPVILGGNMRYEALKKLGYSFIPRDWVQFVDQMGFSDDQKRRFIIQDNQSAGEWNFEILANEFSMEELEAWGVDISFDDSEPGTSGTPASGGHDLNTQVGDVYKAFVGDVPDQQVGIMVMAPKYIGGEPVEGKNDPWKGIFKEIDKSLTKFAKNCKKSGITFTITKNGEDITTKF